MRKTFFLAVIALASCLSTSLFAQNKITGKVSDQTEPLIGVAVVVKGTQNAAMTDVDGNFTLNGVKPTDVLEFHMIGYDLQEVTVGKNTYLDVILKSDANIIDDAIVVSVGYGDVRRRDLTGSIGKANVNDLKQIPVANVASALGGRIAGVNVTSKDGGPGDNFEIVIRGAGSLTGSTAPLYVVDGFPLESSTMGAIDPNDIESIDVLKDASAAVKDSRWTTGTDTASKTGGVSSFISKTEEKHQFFPIPEKELGVNTLLDQNKYWTSKSE